MVAIDDIAQMPMHYNTLVGDMGTVLSGSQRISAGALYKRPASQAAGRGHQPTDVRGAKVVNSAIASPRRPASSWRAPARNHRQRRSGHRTAASAVLDAPGGNQLFVPSLAVRRQVGAQNFFRS
jgi:hypothetical protein